MASEQTASAFFGGFVLAALIAGGIAYFAWPPRGPAEPAKTQPQSQPETKAKTEIVKRAATLDEFLGQRESLSALQIELTGDGSAYLYVGLLDGYQDGPGGGVWYLHGAEAVRVREVHQFSDANIRPTTAPSLLPSIKSKLNEISEQIDHLPTGN